ncbi:hypothetical protein G6F22_020745 [Rhizopus arrhizus]|nr:hypothetical protein G6F22_020745 [Rhizopus arrhizus]
MGVDTARSRMVIFIIAALQACASGWLYAHMQRFVNPNPFGLQMGIEYLFMTVIGGAGQVWGLDAQAAGPDRQLRGHRQLRRRAQRPENPSRRTHLRCRSPARADAAGSRNPHHAAVPAARAA